MNRQSATTDSRDFFRDLFERIFLAFNVIDHHIEAALGHTHSNCAPNTPTGAGNKRDLCRMFHFNSSRNSKSRIAAINRQHSAGYEACSIGREKQNRIGNFSRLTQPPLRRHGKPGRKPFFIAASGQCQFRRGVTGATAFTRTPCFAHSTASDFVIRFTPALAAL